MSNYKKENLIPIPPAAVPAGTLAIKVGDEIFTPGNIKIGQSMDFYKCASVDTANKTWTGYKAVLNDGVYTFEETVTEGLSYGYGLSPVVDSIYDAEALVYVNRLWLGAAAVNEGLALHASLKYNAETAETGQAITYPHSDITWGNVLDVTCMTLNKSGEITIAPAPCGIGDNSVTLAYWIRAINDGYGEPHVGWEYWNGYGLAVGLNSGRAPYVDGYERWGSKYFGSALTDAKWHHMCFTFDVSAMTYHLYIDGEDRGGVEVSTLNAVQNYSIRVSGPAGTSFADVRVYDRALPAEEVALLAANLP